MSNIKRRDFLKISAGIAGAPGRRALLARRRPPGNRRRREAARAALEALRPGDEDQYMKNVAASPRDRRRSARRQRELGDVRPKAAVRRTSARTDVILSRSTTQTLSGEAARRHRSRDYLGKNTAAVHVCPNTSSRASAGSGFPWAAPATPRLRISQMRSGFDTFRRTRTDS